jgi:hypothetical protein
MTMKMLDDMDRRLLNWARYVWEMKEGGRISTPSFEARVDGLGYDAPTVIPTSYAEAEETAVWLASIHLVRSDLHSAVMAWYLAPGGIATKCKRLCVSETTLRERIGLAHRHLSQWLNDKHAKAKARRTRVEALQVASHAGRVGY